MTGRENFKRAIEFKGPAYLPVRFGLGEESQELKEKDEAKLQRIKELRSQFDEKKDIVEFWCSDIWNDIRTKDGIKYWEDEWGVGWADNGSGGRVITSPLKGGYHLLDSYKFPDPNMHAIVHKQYIEDRMRISKERYRLATVWFTLFERMWSLCGFNNMLMAPYLDTENFLRLRDKVMEFNLAKIDEWLKRGADGIFFSDDWGSQTALFIDPNDWRKFYKPAYKKMFERVRAGGAHVWLHSDGNIIAILPDLIEVGLNVLNPVQPQAMDVRLLSREFGGKCCFDGGVDAQGTLVFGTPDDIRREVYELTGLFGRFGGGYIGGTSHVIMTETPIDNVIALYEAFLEIQNKYKKLGGGELLSL